MTRFLRLLLTVAFICLPAAASERLLSSGISILRTAMSGFDLKHPEKDARLAVANNDLKFIGINGYSCHLPGPDGEVLGLLASQYGTRCLAGTSDFIESKEFDDLQEQAVAYAIRYNLQLALILDAREISGNPFKPKSLCALDTAESRHWGAG